jgi:hypothetical protein
VYNIVNKSTDVNNYILNFSFQSTLILTDDHDVSVEVVVEADAQACAVVESVVRSLGDRLSASAVSVDANSSDSHTCPDNDGDRSYSEVSDDSTQRSRQHIPHPLRRIRYQVNLLQLIHLVSRNSPQMQMQCRI